MCLLFSELFNILFAWKPKQHMAAFYRLYITVRWLPHWEDPIHAYKDSLRKINEVKDYLSKVIKASSAANARLCCWGCWIWHSWDSYRRIQLTVSSREVLHATDKMFSHAVNREHTSRFFYMRRMHTHWDECFCDPVWSTDGLTWLTQKDTRRDIYPLAFPFIMYSISGSCSASTSASRYFCGYIFIINDMWLICLMIMLLVALQVFYCQYKRLLASLQVCDNKQRGSFNTAGLHFTHLSLANVS